MQNFATPPTSTGTIEKSIAGFSGLTSKYWKSWKILWEEIADRIIGKLYKAQITVAVLAIQQDHA